jgi:hypothetical protein
LALDGDELDPVAGVEEHALIGLDGGESSRGGRSLLDR